VADFRSSAVGCAAWAHILAAPQLIAATPQIIANHRIENFSLPRARAAPCYVLRLILQGTRSRCADAAHKAYSVGHERMQKGSRRYLFHRLGRLNTIRHSLMSSADGLVID
jgi:hypothetical protein